MYAFSALEIVSTLSVEADRVLVRQGLRISHASARWVPYSCPVPSLSEEVKFSEGYDQCFCHVKSSSNLLLLEYRQGSIETLVSAASLCVGRYMETAPALSPWQPSAGGSLPPTGLKPPSPSHQGRESASPVESASSSQQSLFAGFPSNDASQGIYKEGTSPAQQLRNLQRLYGLAQAHQQASRTSLPDIAEEEPSSEHHAIPQACSMSGLAATGKPASKVMSEEDIFAMGGGLEMRSSSPLSRTESIGAAQGQGSLVQAGAPPLAHDLSLVGQMPAGQSQSRTLFVRNIDASFSDEELHVVFEVSQSLFRHKTC